jgi:hypothetical protein
MKTVLITGNTYPVKDKIKALGGHWDANAKGWQVPETAAQQAKLLVESAPKTAKTSNHRRTNRYSRGVDRYGDCHCDMCSTGNECLCRYGNG